MTRPLNLAHRGASTVAPENTLPAFERALALGADGIELDVQQTRDGALVVIHDETLERTTNGKGYVRSYTLAELKQLDAGAWLAPEWAGTRIPTVDEVFDTLPTTAVVNLELKGVSWKSAGLEAATLALIRRRALWDRVIVSSFNPVALWRLRHAAPQLRLGLLFAPAMPLPLARAWARHLLPLAALHPMAAMVTPRLIAASHDAGLDVNVWTVNEPAQMRTLIDQGVDGIITDVSDALAAVLAE